VAINPISSVLGAGSIANVGNITSTAKTATPSGDFGKTVVDALQNLQDTQNNADNLALKAATGDLSDVHDYMIAATEASVQTDLTVAVRNKAVDAFNEIMRMQV
jgi:flagellar hook-basal body complex protein FliE